MVQRPVYPDVNIKSFEAQGGCTDLSNLLEGATQFAIRLAEEQAAKRGDLGAHTHITTWVYRHMESGDIL